MLEATQDVFGQVLLFESEPLVGGLAWLGWRSMCQGERLVQVYVNEVLYDVSMDSSVRGMWLELDRGEDVRVELVAVDAREAYRDFSYILNGWSPRFVTRGELMLLKDERLDVDSRVVVSVDGVDVDEGRVWSAGDSRDGFGGLFGVGVFGYGLMTGGGYGQGEFGAGGFGGASEFLRWQGEGLSVGPHEIGVRVLDGAGEVVGELDEDVGVVIDEVARGAEGLVMSEGGVLRWS